MEGSAKVTCHSPAEPLKGWTGYVRGGGGGKGGAICNNVTQSLVNISCQSN